MKIVLSVVLLLISIVVVIAGIGLALPSAHTAKTRATLKASPQHAWEAITNVGAFPTWRSDVKSVEVFPPAAGRRTWREDGSNGKISYQEVEAAAPSRFKVRLTDDSLPFGGTWTYDIQPAATGTQLTITEDGIVRNPIFRFVSRFVFGHYKTQETYLRDLAKKFGETVTAERL
ncbi:MAG: SRPBCC family protein [Gemmatimonadaceae bacterium]|nr:SRPBCC family protein [Gemmatimonadaceae bacterium]